MWKSLFPVVFIAFISKSSEFLVADSCMGSLLCTCNLPIVDCSDKQLPIIPELNMTSHQNMVYLYLQKNRIVVVPQHSFDGIKADKVYLDLSNNHLTSIHPKVFDNLHQNITILKLEHNLLSSLPVALTNLSKLTYLDLHDNPIATFDQSVMSSLGSHLGIFYVGSSAMKTWPSEFQYLKRLNALHLFGASFSDIPPEAFSGFEKSLINLEINGTNLSSVPSALCNLTRLRNFYFNHNYYVNDDDILPQCSSPMTSVSAITLDQNHLTSFPVSIFYQFPNLKTLSISSNQHLDSMAGAYIPSGMHLTSLTMGENSFIRVPSEISDLVNLRILDLHSNSLAELLNNDLSQLMHLSRLILNDNPIVLVEDSSFKNNSDLFHLSLENTNLPTIPRALLDLSHLHTLDFKGNIMNCTCNDLQWMTSWGNINSLHVTGSCGNKNSHLNEDIQTYLQLEVQNCP